MDFVVALGSALVAGPLLGVAPLETAVVAGACVLLAPLSSRRTRALLALVILVGLMFGFARSHQRIAVYLSERARLDRELPPIARCAGRAVVTGSPVLQGESLRWSAEFDGASCDGGQVWHPFRATLYGGPSELARGDTVEVIAEVGAPQRLTNRATGDPIPGETRRNALRSGGALDVRIVTKGRGILAWIDRARAHVRARIAATFPAETAAMARALVLGEADLAPEDDEAFRTSGLAHLLAVSGMHLVIAVVSFVAALRALFVRVEAFAGRVEVGRIAAVVGIAVAWAYADFAGGSGSALRAAWMLSAAFFATAIGRRSDGPRALGLSLLAVGLADPLAIYDVSFLLSGAATAGLLAFTVDFPRASPFDRTFARSASATFAATLPCAPILARFAPTLPLGGVLANLVAVPLGECAALPLCLLHAVLGFFPAAEGGCALAASGGLWLVREVARAFASSTWLSVAIPPPTSWQLVALAIAQGSLVVLSSGLRRRAVVLACAAVAVLAELGAIQAGVPHGKLRASFLDVGQGDAALIDLPSGEALLLDAGGLVGSPIDVGARVIGPTLRARRRRDLSVVLLSHPHPDHYGGFLSGIRGLRVASVWDTGQGEREGVSGAYAHFISQMRARNVPVLHPETLCGSRLLGGAIVEVLAPCPTVTPDRGPNDNSYVVRITFGNRGFLFAGDAEIEEEADLVRASAGRLRADLLKIGHHGSRTSSSRAFLEAVAPREAVISVGARNRFGHPSQGTLLALRNAGARVWRTDQDGEVIAETDGTSLRVFRSRDPPN